MSEPSSTDLGPHTVQLLHHVGALAKCDGDPGMAAVLLTAACSALASLKEGDQVLRASPQRRLPIGMNLLISGAISSEQTARLVVEPLRKLQGNVARATVPYLAARPPRHLDRENDELHRRRDLNPGECHYMEPSDESLAAEGFERPLVVVSATTRKAIEARLTLANRARLLLHVPLSRIEQADPLDSILNDLISGSCPLPASSPYGVFESVGGNVIVTASEAIVNALANPELCYATWPNRVVWLNAGIDLPKPDLSKGDKPSHDFSEIYQDAAHQLIEGRLSGREFDQMSFPDFRLFERYRKGVLATEWLEETKAPLLNLQATLWFGVAQLLATRPPGGYDLNRAVRNLAYIVAGAAGSLQVNCRHRVELERNQRLARNILAKLAEEGGTTRELVRRSHKVDTATMGRVLADMARLGVVCQIGNRWELVEKPVNSDIIPTSESQA